MKAYHIVLITLLFFATSCENTWDSETKEMFHQSCLEDAAGWAGDKAKPYCDCVLDRVMKKYPNYKDALMNMDSVITDTHIRACKADIVGKQ